MESIQAMLSRGKAMGFLGLSNILYIHQHGESQTHGDGTMTEATTESTTAVAVHEFKSGLEQAEHNSLCGRFNEVTGGLSALLVTAGTIKVEGADDLEAMELARATRLGLRKVRVDVENVIKFHIVPVEEHLQKMEDYVKRIEDERIAREKAAAEQAEVDRVERERIDAENEKLRAEAEEREKKEAAAQKVRDEEAAEREKKEAADKAERDAETKRIQDEHAAEQKKADNARIKAEEEAQAVRDEEAARIRKEADEKAAKEIADRDAELARVKAEKEAEQARLAAPDADKLRALDQAICAIEIPTVSSDVALAVVAGIRGRLNGIVQSLREAMAEIGD